MAGRLELCSGLGCVLVMNKLLWTCWTSRASSSSEASHPALTACWRLAAISQDVHPKGSLHSARRTALHAVTTSSCATSQTKTPIALTLTWFVSQRLSCGVKADNCCNVTHALQPRVVRERNRVRVCWTSAVLEVRRIKLQRRRVVENCGLHHGKEEAKAAKREYQLTDAIPLVPDAIPPPFLQQSFVVREK